MSQEYDIQIHSYIEHKRKQYQKHQTSEHVEQTDQPVAASRTHNIPNQQTQVSLGENASLMNAYTTPVETDSFCKSCFDAMLGCNGCNCFANCTDCSTKCQGCCSISQNSLQVLTLPLTREGVPLRIHYLWPFFIVFTSLTALQLSPMFALFSFILGGPILFLTVLIHEIGHALMAIRLGGHVKQILLWPLGGLAYISMFGESSPKSDALVAIAGPLTHIPQILFWMMLMSMSNRGSIETSWQLGWGLDFWLSLCAGAIAMQIALCLFNLIPAYPLDGGRLLGALLLTCGVDRNRSFIYMAIIGGVFGWYLVINGLSTAFSSSFTFFSGWNQLALGIFIAYNCHQLWRLGMAGVAETHPGYEYTSSSNSSAYTGYAGYTDPTNRSSWPAAVISSTAGRLGGSQAQPVRLSAAGAVSSNNSSSRANGPFSSTGRILGSGPSSSSSSSSSSSTNAVDSVADSSSRPVRFQGGHGVLGSQTSSTAGDSSDFVPPSYHQMDV